jgi:hypothetical protein
MNRSSFACPPDHGEVSTSSPCAAKLAPLKAVPERGHFLFQRLTALLTYRSRLSQIIFRARCWWLIQRIALKMWWRG